jgi:hypothetical protein
MTLALVRRAAPQYREALANMPIVRSRFCNLPTSRSGTLNSGDPVLNPGTDYAAHARHSHVAVGVVHCPNRFYSVPPR